MRQESSTWISLGVWISRGGIDWSDAVLLATYLELEWEPLIGQAPYLPLIFDMIEEFADKYSTEATVYLWKAQQSYRIIQAVFSSEEQELIRLARQARKNHRVAGLTKSPKSLTLVQS